MTPLFLLSTISITSQATVKCVLVWLRRPARCCKWGKINNLKNCYTFLVPRVFLCSSMAAVRETQPRSQSSSAISDVAAPVKLVAKIRSRFQASSYSFFFYGNFFCCCSFLLFLFNLFLLSLLRNVSDMHKSPGFFLANRRKFLCVIGKGARNHHHHHYRHH